MKARHWFDGSGGHYLTDDGLALYIQAEENYTKRGKSSSGGEIGRQADIHMEFQRLVGAEQKTGANKVYMVSSCDQIPNGTQLAKSLELANLRSHLPKTKDGVVSFPGMKVFLADQWQWGTVDGLINDKDYPFSILQEDGANRQPLGKYVFSSEIEARKLYEFSSPEEAKKAYDEAVKDITGGI